MDLSKRLGTKVRKLRKGLKWTQERLAEKAEMSQQHVCSIEGGAQNVTLESVAKLAKAFGVPDFELLLPPDVEVRKKPQVQGPTGREG